jgi:hypothetical protein
MRPASPALKVMMIGEGAAQLFVPIAFTLRLEGSSILPIPAPK